MGRRNIDSILCPLLAFICIWYIYNVLSVFCDVPYNLNQRFLYVLAIDCEDSFFFSSNCAYWAKDGLCTNNLEFMVKNCKKSCNLCQGEMTYLNVLFLSVKESEYNFQKICLHKIMKFSFFNSNINFNNIGTK